MTRYLSSVKKFDKKILMRNKFLSFCKNIYVGAVNFITTVINISNQYVMHWLPSILFGVVNFIKWTIDLNLNLILKYTILSD